MDVRLTAGLFGFGILALAAQSVSAQSVRNCAPREVVIERLTTTYGEARQSIGLGENNSLMEVFAARDSGTWTITVTIANGMTCLVASGKEFETLAGTISAEASDT